MWPILVLHSMLVLNTLTCGFGPQNLLERAYKDRCFHLVFASHIIQSLKDPVSLGAVRGQRLMPTLFDGDLEAERSCKVGLVGA